MTDIAAWRRLRLAWEGWLRRRERALPLGKRGERAAERSLRRSGLRIILRNYRASRGEIDLIAREGDTLVFVEVKTRRRGDPAEAVDAEKRARLIRAARGFILRHDLEETPKRFDVVAVVWSDDEAEPEIRHIRDAFSDPEEINHPRLA